VRYVLLSSALARPCIYPLSLHDALPIFFLTRPEVRGPAQTAGRPSAACKVLSSRVATVIGPTPPGTGVIQAARSLAASNSTSPRSEEHTSELQSRSDLVCRLLLEKKNIQ